MTEHEYNNMHWEVRRKYSYKNFYYKGYSIGFYQIDDNALYKQYIAGTIKIYELTES